MDNLDLNQMLAKLAKMDKAELEKNLKIAQQILNNSNNNNNQNNRKN